MVLAPKNVIKILNQSKVVSDIMFILNIRNYDLFYINVLSSR